MAAKKLKKITPDYLRQIEKGLCNWQNLSAIYELSEDFIRKYKNKLNWGIICIKQKFSEEFIIEFQHKANWDYISSHQKLSTKFVKEFCSRINFNYLPLCFFKMENPNSWKTFF